MRIAVGTFIFLCLAPLALGQAYKVTPEGLKPSPETPTISVPSPADATNSMTAAAAANVARQQAIDAANRAARKQNRGAAEKIKLNVVPLSNEALKSWKRRSDGSRICRDGRYQAEAMPLGYRIRVMDGPKQFSTALYPNLDAAIAEAVKWTGDDPPNIPGSHSYSPGLAAKEKVDEKRTADIELAWAYAGQTPDGESWKDSTGTYTIVSDPKTDAFSLLTAGKSVKEKLSTIDDAIEAAERHTAKSRSRSR